MTAFFQRPIRRCLAWLLIGGSATHACADTLAVTNAADIGAGTLRQVVSDATAGDTIEFSLTFPAVIYIATTITIDKSLTIEGPGADQLTLDGEGFTDSVLSISAGATLDISEISMRNSSLGAIYNNGTLTVSHAAFSENYSNNYGGAIINVGGLTVSDSTFTHNQAGNGGGAIYNNAGATVNRCSFTGNTAVNDGGAIYNLGSIGVNASTLSGNSAAGNFGGTGGAITNKGTLVVTNSTLTGNSTSGAGGAIFTRGTLTVSGSTISDNSVPTGGGSTIANYINASVSRSILVGTCYGSLVSGGDNIGSTDSCFDNSTDLNDRNNLNARLGPLADNGGPTLTQLLQSGSPAIDAVLVNTADCTGTDQRGIPRPSGIRCDIGAVELDVDTVFANGFD